VKHTGINPLITYGKVMKRKMIMMKKYFTAILILMVVFCTIYPAYACTSFAVYSDEPVYAMNFDYPETELRLVVEESKKMNVFFLQFMQGGRYQSTAGMNEKGLFTALQMQYPQLSGQSSRSGDEMFIYELAWSIDSNENVEDAMKALGNKRLVQMKGLTLHTMLADPEGNAVIAEAGIDGNELIPITDDFIVMTNFKNSDYKDIAYDKIPGIGSDRYIKAYEYISGNRDSFHFENALEGLKMNVQDGGSFPTLSSIVFVPAEKYAYIALHRDFDRLWKVSVEDKTIETFRGFEKHVKIQIPKNGVLASDLMNGNYEKYKLIDESDSVPAGKNTEENSSGKGNLQTYLFIIPAVAILLLLCVILIPRGKIRKNNSK